MGNLENTVVLDCILAKYQAREEEKKAVTLEGKQKFNRRAFQLKNSAKGALLTEKFLN